MDAYLSRQLGGLARDMDDARDADQVITAEQSAELEKACMHISGVSEALQTVREAREGLRGSKPQGGGARGRGQSRGGGQVAVQRLRPARTQGWLPGVPWQDDA